MTLFNPIDDHVFSFDTSAFIKGRRDLLPPEVFPTFWSKIEQEIAVGSVRAVDEVRQELSKRDDDTRKWAVSQSGLFVELEIDIQESTTAVLTEHPKLTGMGGGRHQADPFVIGFALARNGTVVTEELRTNSLGKPRIPDVCDAMGVRCLSLVEFARDQSWSF